MEASFSSGKWPRSLSSRAMALIKKYDYWLAFAFSLFCSVLLIIVLRYSHAEAVAPDTLMNDARTGLNCLLKELDLPWHGACTHILEKPDLKSISDRIHPLPGFWSGVWEILGVIAISFMWVCAVISHKKLRMFLSLLVTLAYVYSMFQSYQPAVLAAALIAIIAAAQHLGTLHEQTEKVDHQLGLLDSQTKTIGTMLDNVRRIASSTQLSLTESGRDIFTQDVYRAYGRASTIYAVVRDHGIEKEWWAHALETADTKRDGLTKVWEWYYGTSEKDSESDLYRALTRPRHQNDGTEAAGVKSAYLVSYMPTPDFFDPNAEITEWNSDKSQRFDDLLGLAWECLVLDKVRNELKNIDAIGEWISRPLCWTHATDKEVIQVVKRVPDTASIVLKTADLITSELNNLDYGMSKKIIESTQAEIRRYLQRGVPAEEYLCAVLCYACADDDQGVLYEDPDLHRHDPRIESCLSRIYLDEWVNSKQQQTRGRSRALAVAIFKEFIHLCWIGSKTGLGEAVPCPTDRSLFLAREVL